MNDIQATVIELDHSQPKTVQNEHISIESAIHKLLDDSDTHLKIKENPMENFDLTGKTDELVDGGSIVFGGADMDVGGKELTWESLFDDGISTGLFSMEIKDAAVMSMADMSGETLATPNGNSDDNVVATNRTGKRAYENDTQEENRNGSEKNGFGPAAVTTASAPDIKRLKTGKSELSIVSDIIRSQNEPFMSPISLSPSNSTSSESTDLRMKLDAIPIISSSSHRNQQATSAGGKKAKEGPRHQSQLTETVFKQIPTPKPLTNEFTMLQVSEMKKRIINTHKLLLNFNYLKDGYARTCVELKKTLECLRDSELHRAHLLLENERLKKKLQEVSTDCKIDSKVEDTNMPPPPRPASATLPASHSSPGIDAKKEGV